MVTSKCEAEIGLFLTATPKKKNESLFALGCENSDVAGLTISYQGYVYLLSNQRSAWLIKLIIMFQNKII